jgi:hypothetical protein
MKPIFTIHAGEYLVASEIEKNLKKVNVWIPSKDTGIDLLLTDELNIKTTSIQVKFSKDFNSTLIKQHLREHIKGSGWWKLDRKKIQSSRADFWIFIIYSFEKKSHDYIILNPFELITLFDELNRFDQIVHCYFTVTNDNKAFETRGLKDSDKKSIYLSGISNPSRDVSKYLNNWELINSKLR